MSSVRFPASTGRMLLVLFAGLASLAVAGGPGYAADAKTAAVLPSPTSMTGTPSGSELVGKLLTERSTSSDPDVPFRSAI